MSYATVMVHIDPEGDSASRIAIAAELSRRNQSKLIGVGAWSPGMGFAADVAVINDEPVRHEAEELTTLMTTAEQRFRTAARGIKDTEWRGALRRSPLDHLVQEARSADLVVIGMRPALDRHCVALETGAALLRMGRPVLAVPAAVAKLNARRIVIAWKDCREARRAVRDALGILREADEVTIVEVSEKTMEQEAVKRLDDLGAYLSRHRVSVGSKVFLRGTHTIAADILSCAQKEKADLLVAGAYGHSRLGEWVFGGVTRELLQDCPICCLFAH